jgi:hypothetical protein
VEARLQNDFYMCEQSAGHKCVIVHHLFPVKAKKKDPFLDHILMFDESWMHSFDQKLKQHSAMLCISMSLRKKNAISEL